MIVVLANYLASRQKSLNSIWTILGACVLMVPAWLLVLLQPDLGTSLVLGRDPGRDAVHVGRQRCAGWRSWRR